MTNMKLFIRKNKKIIAFLFGTLLAFVGIVLNYTYRQYVYTNKINDFHFADTIGSLLCVPAGSLFLYGIAKKKKPFKEIIIAVTIANIVYELSSLLGYHGVFDYYDLGAILVGSFISFKLAVCVKKYLQNENP